MKNQETTYIAILLAFLAPAAFAVVPPPDGGYPGGNTAEGQNALFSLTTGGYNTAVGFLSLRSDTTGGFNTGHWRGDTFRQHRGLKYCRWRRSAIKQYDWRG
jgi:hypothetical protein